jgi:hypothetical protein
VHEHERLALSAHEVAKPAAAYLGEALFESWELYLCIRHPGRLFFRAMKSLGRQDP